MVWNDVKGWCIDANIYVGGVYIRAGLWECIEDVSDFCQNQALRNGEDVEAYMVNKWGCEESYPIVMVDASGEVVEEEV